MNAWWAQQEWPCVCNRRDGTMHTHYPDAPHRCARCRECKEYRPDIPEHTAIRMLLGPMMSNEEAATILLGPPVASSSPGHDERQLTTVNRDIVVRRAQARPCSHGWVSNPCYACLADEAAEWMHRADERSVALTKDQRIMSDALTAVSRQYEALMDALEIKGSSDSGVDNYGLRHSRALDRIATLRLAEWQHRMGITRRANHAQSVSGPSLTLTASQVEQVMNALESQGEAARRAAFEMIQDAYTHAADFTMSCSVCGEPVVLDPEDADVRHTRCAVTTVHVREPGSMILPKDRP